MKDVLYAVHFSVGGRLAYPVTAESDVARDLLMPTDADKDRDCLTSCLGSTRMSLGYRLCSTNFCWQREISISLKGQGGHLS